MGPAGPLDTFDRVAWAPPARSARRARNPGSRPDPGLGVRPSHAATLHHCGPVLCRFPASGAKGLTRLASDARPVVRSGMRSSKVVVPCMGCTRCSGDELQLQASVHGVHGLALRTPRTESRSTLRASHARRTRILSPDARSANSRPAGPFGRARARRPGPEPGREPGPAAAARVRERCPAAMAVGVVPHEQCPHGTHDCSAPVRLPQTSSRGCTPRPPTIGTYD
jgi:hypothetical protein